MIISAQSQSTVTEKRSEGFSRVKLLMLLHWPSTYHYLYLNMSLIFTCGTNTVTTLRMNRISRLIAFSFYFLSKYFY